MFKLEIIELLNKYKKSGFDDKKNIETEITKLILDNENEYESFMESSIIDQNSYHLLQELKEKAEKKIEEIDEKADDYEIIKKQFLKWNEIYHENGNLVDEKNEKIINDIISFYIINRFEILQETLKINDSEDFEKFKNMLKNYIRKYFAQKIQEYRESESFKELGFFAKRKKKNQLLNTLDDLGEYKFNKTKIEEVIR